jgi:hypothetical protein
MAHKPHHMSAGHKMRDGKKHLGGKKLKVMGMGLGTAGHEAGKHEGKRSHKK